MVPRIKAALQATGRPFEVHVTEKAGAGRTAADRYARDGAGLILAVGGDGSMHEVANGICDSGMSVPMGLVPIGHGSDFVRTTGTSHDIAAAVNAACNGRVRPIDLGRATFADGSSTVFINVAGLGFDALVAERAGKTKRLPGSNLPYLAAALQTLVTYKNIQVALDVDGELISTYAVFVQVANAKYMGGGYKIAPDADIEDGLLDLALVGDIAKPDLLKTLPKVYSGKHVSHPKFRHIRAKRIHVESMQPANVQLDGELCGAAPVTFTVMPAALYLAG